ncbi:TrkA family potassium uptake protein [Sphingomonas sp.]|uniref:potassium channel family protein n=1 Tax=Sphingomonas sp. TaxID=28214 RepID=UPI001B0E53AF|nr:potassium channel protein [Sphingomonas sp.]MBO9712101.1 potassium channel protein [Sphingomonas sp.]
MRGHFFNDTQSVLGSPLRNLVSILAFVAAVAVLAILAYMAAGWSFEEASYMVVLTIYTVGYGEVRPIDTPWLHFVTMATMVLGCTGMILLTGALVQFLTVMQIRELLGGNRMNGKIAKLTDHVVICGYGRIGVMLATELKRAGVPLIVVERGAARLAEAEAAGHITYAGDATEEDVLVQAGIDRARALATVLPDDAANVFISLSARSFNPKLEIIARGEAPTTERKLIHAGANHVIFPTHIGAEKIARLILYPASEDLLDDDRIVTLRRELDTLGLSVEQVIAAPEAAVCGMTVEQAQRNAEGAFFVVAIARVDGTQIPRPALDERIEAGDKVTLVFRDAARAARTLFTKKREIRAGRNIF